MLLIGLLFTLMIRLAGEDLPLVLLERAYGERASLPRTPARIPALPLVARVLCPRSSANNLNQQPLGPGAARRCLWNEAELILTV